MSKEFHGQIITTASADVPLKGLDFTLQAVARLKEEYPQLRLVIIGAPRAGGHTESVNQKTADRGEYCLTDQT